MPRSDALLALKEGLAMTKPTVLYEADLDQRSSSSMVTFWLYEVNSTG